MADGGRGPRHRVRHRARRDVGVGDPPPRRGSVDADDEPRRALSGGAARLADALHLPPGLLIQQRGGYMAEERHPLHDLFEDQIKDLYSAENQLVKALPKMAKNSTNPQLRTAFERHLEETRNQVARLEQIAEELD